MLNRPLETLAMAVFWDHSKEETSSEEKWPKIGSLTKLAQVASAPVILLILLHLLNLKKVSALTQLLFGLRKEQLTTTSIKLMAPLPQLGLDQTQLNRWLTLPAKEEPKPGDQPLVSILINNLHPHIPQRPLSSRKDMLIIKAEASLTTGGFLSNVLHQLIQIHHHLIEVKQKIQVH